MIDSQLYDLVHSGDLNGVARWLDREPGDLNTWIGDRLAPLHVACIFGHEHVARHLLGRGALVNLHSLNESGAEPLHFAVLFRDEEVADRLVRMLLDNGAELNGIQREGETALHHAVARGSIRLVSTLIEAGADPFFKDKLGRSPADLAKNIGDQRSGARIREELKRAFALT